MLAELGTPQVAAFEQVLKSHDLKTLFLKAGEMTGNKKGLAIADAVEAYLQSGLSRPHWNYTARRVNRTNGFTARSWNHVVVKAKASDNLAKVDALQLRDAIVAAIGKGRSQEGVWSFSAAAEAQLNSSARVVTTWVHEMGHQVYYRAGQPVIPPQVKGRPSLTKYGGTNNSEWFAEHFAAWLLAPEELEKVLPDAFVFITEAVNAAAKQ